MFKTKAEIFGHKRSMSAQTPHTNCLHDGGEIMILYCFLTTAPGHLAVTEYIMISSAHQNILESDVRASAWQLKLDINHMPFSSWSIILCYVDLWEWKVWLLWIQHPGTCSKLTYSSLTTSFWWMCEYFYFCVQILVVELHVQFRNIDVLCFYIWIIK